MRLRLEYLVLLVTFTCTRAGPGRRKYNCRHAPVPRYGDDIAELDIPPRCYGGVIVWRYPAGYLHLMSEKLAGYSLCIQENWKTWMGNLRVVSIHGLQQIPVPLPDNLSCVHDRFGIAEMVVMARPMLSDTVSFSYRIIKYDFS